MLEDAVNYPIRGEEAALTIGLGGLLSFLWFLLFVPVVFVFGYLVRVLAGTVDGEDVPPRWNEWGDLAIDGVVGLVLSVVFYAAPFVVVVLFSGVGGISSDPDVAAAGVLVGVLVALPLFAVFGYVHPAVLAEFGSGRRGDGFDGSRVVAAVTSGSYLFAWIVGFTVQIASFFFLFFFLLIPIVGWLVLLVGPVVAFAANVAAFRAFGVAYRRAQPDAT